MSLTAVELGRKIKEKEITAVEAAKAAIEAVKAKEDKVNSFVTVVDEEAILKRAEAVQEAIEAGKLTGPLAGVPVAIKDNMCTEGIKTTCSSKILYNLHQRSLKTSFHSTMQKSLTVWKKQDL